MKKICKRCGREFDTQQPYFKYCSTCFSPSQSHTDLSQLLLRSYHDEKGNILKEVYIDVPEKLANVFSKDKLGTKQLREFHSKILKARKKSLLKGIDAAKSILYECQRDIEYQLKRGVIPNSFAKFMKHHLTIAEKDEKLLEGFFQHLDSIVC